MAEVSPHPVCYYLAVFLIGSLISIFLAFEPNQMVDPSTNQCLLSFFFESVCQLKDLFKVNFNIFKTEPKVCLVKYLLWSLDTKVNHNLFKSCVGRKVYRWVGQYQYRYIGLAKRLHSISCLAYSACFCTNISHHGLANIPQCPVHYLTDNCCESLFFCNVLYLIFQYLIFGVC